MQHTFNDGKWIWYDLQEGQTEELEEIISTFPTCNNWYRDIIEKDSNFIHLNTQTRGKEYVWGSLIYKQDIEEKDGKSIFNFYISKEFIITNGFDMSLLERAPASGVLKQMEQAENGVDGFFIILGEILSDYLIKIDEYEERLNNLLWKLKEENNLTILDEIYKNRHELLIWKNLLIPVTELKFTAAEAFGCEINDLIEFYRVETRIERIRTLLGEYQQEIDTMIRLEEVVSTHRGNEIMKTLTVMTVLFTPIMAWGALWGMNFKVMPELEWKLGYAFAGALIILSTVGLYIYLRAKGWIGDILKGREKNSFFR
ncbi:MAG TPA: Mg2+ transporter protein, CorA-like protein [Bacillus bacterium]|nr:Mg2+ transporter protein, CorA-like protein [Bacillus sp. (in: firmicutes)]